MGCFGRCLMLFAKRYRTALGHTRAQPEREPHPVRVCPVCVCRVDRENNRPPFRAGQRCVPQELRKPATRGSGPPHESFFRTPRIDGWSCKGRSARKRGKRRWRLRLETANSRWILPSTHSNGNDLN
jgi:hypothetical protein